MTRETTQDNDRALKEEAVEWLIRLGEAPETGALRDEFESWLSQTPAHARAWEKACLLWASIGEAPAFYEQRQTTTTTTALPTRRRWIVASFVTAMAALCLAYVAVPNLLLRLEADYRTETAEIRRVMLEDGSVVTLGPQSAIAMDFSSAKRTIRLLDGEIYLDVIHRNSMPFHVVSPDLDISVLGTAFNVRVDGEGTEVGLERGAIKATGAVAGRAIDDTLAPGDLVAVSRGTGEVRRNQVALDTIGAWRTQRLVVSDATIGSVIEQIRRYHSAFILLADPSFADRRVTGIFELSDPDKALIALVAPYHGKVRHISPYGRLVTGF